MKKAIITLKLGDKVRLVNFLVENRERLQDLGISDLNKIVKREIDVTVGNQNLGGVYRVEAGYPKLRVRSFAHENLEARVAKLEARISKMETLWK